MCYDCTTLEIILNFIHIREIWIAKKNVEIIVNEVWFSYRQQHFLICLLFISKGFVTSCKFLTITRVNRFLIKTTEATNLSE